MSDLVFSPRHGALRLALCTLPFLNFARFVSLDPMSREILHEYADVFGPPIRKTCHRFLALPNTRHVLRHLAGEMEGALKDSVLDIAWRCTSKGWLTVEDVSVSLYRKHEGLAPTGAVRVDFGGLVAFFVPETRS